ncbi:LysR family transcriptional regulator [Phaeobacter gallaeciensis]|uniref:LysR family transcriptional regulator n=1 Tax=Phaeobacter gallaeciensis TaxID=60890 RepID=UPI000BBCAAAE|nr:LysR family transcriptional regulator [Phaeobacter gallaeciensis]ATF17844.1 Transcriptional regulator [Phaeobacter gallaeciensis]ATF21953.1 Transcriptional regulator [Phaeobacter gallaeciensis]
MFQFSLRQLTFLSEVARCGGIAPAARNLNVSAAAISSALDKLEAVTGLILFDRFPARGMRLTSAGADFLVDADVLLTRAKALQRRAAELAKGETGTIRIGTHYAIAQQIVLPAVLTFRERYARVDIEVVEDDFSNLVASLDAGDVDALVVFNQGFGDTRFEVEIVKTVPPLVLLPASHPLAHADSVDLESLSGIPYINVSPAGPGPSYLDLLRAAGLKPEVPLTSQSREMVQAYVGKGLGFTLVGFQPRRNLTIEGDAVVTRPLAQEIGHFEIALAVARTVKPPDLVTEFLDVCRAQV